jgi:hypothetical protein
MKLGIALLLLFGFPAFGGAQENSSSKPGARPSIGLPVGSTAPAFAFLDQFDRSQSNDTLKGSNGTIILFFRSADW